MTPHDAWDYDGVNEEILVNLPVNGVSTPVLVHFDRNGYAYVLDRRNGKLIAAHPFDPSDNTITSVNMKTGRPVYNPRYETHAGHNTTGACPSSMGAKDEAPASFDPQTGLFYTPTNHVCMDYQPIAVKYVPGFPYVGAIVRMYPGPGGYLGAFIGFNPLTGKYEFRDKERFAAWGGALTTAGGLAFYGTMDGWLKAIDVHTGKLLWQFKCPSGIIGNVMTYTNNGKQHVAVYSGVGGWAGIGLAMGLTKPTAGLGAVNAFNSLGNYTNLGGTLMVFSL
jgi:PQQ-dependent dehydrogenase (methanol/ethanol family)